VTASIKLLHKSKLLQFSISGMRVIEVSLTLSFLYQYQYVSCSKSKTIVQCLVCNSISVFKFDLLHGWNCAPNIKCIFCATFFSFGSISLLPNFQKLSAVLSNAAYVVCFYWKMLCLLQLKLLTVTYTQN